MTGSQFSGPPVVAAVPTRLVSTLVASFGIGVVVLFVSGRVDLFWAGLLLVAPVVLGLGVLRPEWIILVIVGLPPSIILPIAPMRMVALMLVALFGFLLQGGLRLGFRTGVYPLVGIIALAFALKGSTPLEAATTADAILHLITYYTLLMLVAFQSATSRRIRADTFVDALLFGIVGACILQPFVAGFGFEAINQTPFRGQIAYLTVMGFGVTYVRWSLRHLAGVRQSPLDAPLAGVFLCLAAVGFVRAAWVAGLLVLALVSRWTGRKAFWIILSLLVVLVLTVPIVGERVLPGGSVGVAEEAIAQVTTGRSVLWEELWKRGADALPFGNGWGYTWSLSSEEIFGFGGQFGAVENGVVFPHNDFLFLFVELGILGLGLLVVYWLDLLRTIRHLSRGRLEQSRYDVRVLVPVILVMFVVQVFDNGFAIRFVAERFFIAAGLVFGLRHQQLSELSDVPHSGSLGTTAGSFVPDR